MEMGRNNSYLNYVIEKFIDQYDGTSIGESIRNMYENGSSYESICDCLDLEYEDFCEDEGR